MSSSLAHWALICPQCHADFHNGAHLQELSPWIVRPFESIDVVVGCQAVPNIALAFEKKYELSINDSRRY